MRPGAISAGLLSALLFVAVITLISLEGREVVVLRTTTPEGTTRETRTWIADHDGFAWIEAANPQRGFYRDIIENPRVELERAGGMREYDAAPMPQPEGHILIRRLLSEKYGLADRWIGLLTDTSESIAIRLRAVASR